MLVIVTATSAVRVLTLGEKLQLRNRRRKEIAIQFSDEFYNETGIQLYRPSSTSHVMQLSPCDYYV